MAKINKIISFMDHVNDDIRNEVWDREEQAENKIDLSPSWEDSNKGRDYINKTEALDELRNRIFEVIEQAYDIKNKNY